MVHVLRGKVTTLLVSMHCQAGAVDPAELAMYAALMTSNTNVEMVEYLMAGMWILLKHPDNRRVLGGAFQLNPAASKLAGAMVEKLQDTIEVADVNSQVHNSLIKATAKNACCTPNCLRDSHGDMVMM